MTLTINNFWSQAVAELILRYEIDLPNVYNIFKGKIWEILGKNLPAVGSHPGGTKITLQRGSSALPLGAFY